MPIDGDCDELPVSYEPTNFSSKFEQQQSNNKSDSNTEAFRILYPLFYFEEKCKIVPL